LGFIAVWLLKDGKDCLFQLRESDKIVCLFGFDCEE